MELKKITIESKAVFDKYYSKFPPRTSYHSFANLFLWRDAEQLCYAEKDEFIIVSGINAYDGTRYVMFPIGGGDCRELTNEFIKLYGKDFKIFAITEENAKNVDKLCHKAYEVVHLRNMDNYIYEVEKMISLSGKKLHSKRNHINKFKEEYDYVYESLTEENALECLEFAGKWYEEKTGEDKTLNFEKQATRDAVFYRNELGLRGGIIRVSGEIVAFTVGEQLNPDTVLVHIEKANTDYHGAYAVINQEFLAHEWKDMKYVNREEDMGIEGLRKAKLSYQPCEILEIYAAIPR